MNDCQTMKKPKLCKYCGVEIGKSVGCSQQNFWTKCKPTRRIPFRGLIATDECPRCGAHNGCYHHAGCPEEECPKCGDKVQECGCMEGAL
ncbi:MAG: hypothetical protein JW737_00305 [Acidobacteria bacterium]|nr:hypothetical protein [Acidobacteriota bacterium]